MSHNYGLISQVDAACIEKTIDLIAKENKNGFINILEVGCYAGETGNGMREYAKSKGFDVLLSGIDNAADREPLRFEYDNFILGNSVEVYNRIPDHSQHLILVDALHTFPAVVSDYFCFASKVKIGGYFIFHDTGKHLDPLSGWQGVGDKNDPDMCIAGVRKALSTIGLIPPPEGSMADMLYQNLTRLMWELVFDEADENDAGGGVCVFRKK